MINVNIVHYDLYSEIRRSITTYTRCYGMESYDGTLLQSPAYLTQLHESKQRVALKVSSPPVLHRSAI